MIPVCQSLVKIESTSGREGPIIEQVASLMEGYRFSTVRIDAAGNAVGRIGKTDEQAALLIDAHVDTVPPASPADWVHDPFGGEIAAGRLWGLGSVDMKGGLAAALVGLGCLASERWQPSRPIDIVASVGEETVEGAALSTALQGEPHPSCVVIAEPTSLRVAVAQRGRAKVRVTITGRSSHAAYPERGVNAIEYMARLIGSMGSRLSPGHHPVLGSRSFSVIDISSEPYPSINTIPSKCTARFDCRLLPDDGRESVLDWFRQLTDGWQRDLDLPAVEVGYELASFSTYAGRAYSRPEFMAAWETSPGHDCVGAAQSALRAAGLAGDLGHYGFCTNGSLTAGDLGITTIGFGPGEQAVAHSVDESISLSELELAARGFYELARNFGSESS